MLPKVYFLSPAEPILGKTLISLGFDLVDLTQADEATVQTHLPEATGLVVRSRFWFSSTFLASAQKLKFIARVGIGLDHIDEAYCQEQGIQVFNSPEGSRDAVAEHTVGLMLGLLHHIGRADREIRAGHWRREPNRGTELGPLTVGIIGYGNTGSALARRLFGFGCRVIAYDKYKSHYGDEFAEEVSPEVIFAEADVVSLHIPYSPDNHYLVSRDWLARFTKSIYLINTARGKILHTQALVDALQDGTVLGTALDVVEYESTSFVSLDVATLPPDFRYLQQSGRCILSPHVAGWSHRAKRLHAQVLADKVATWWNEEAKD